MLRECLENGNKKFEFDAQRTIQDDPAADGHSILNIAI